MLTNKFTIGGEATASAGPVGRDLSAQTDAVLRAEMLSYSRSRGLFAGISLDGATLRPDDEANRELYGADTGNKEILTGQIKTPVAADKVEALLNRNLPPNPLNPARLKGPRSFHLAQDLVGLDAGDTIHLPAWPANFKIRVSQPSPRSTRRSLCERYEPPLRTSV